MGVGNAKQRDGVRKIEIINLNIQSIRFSLDSYPPHGNSLKDLNPHKKILLRLNFESKKIIPNRLI
jgi:hypothetical protein